MQRVKQALTDADRTDAQLGDAAQLEGKAVTVVDVIAKDGETVAKVRDAEGRVSEVKLEELERVATVDLGMGPMRLDQRVPIGRAEDGSPRYMTVREIIRDIENDEAMVRAMSTCARA